MDLSFYKLRISESDLILIDDLGGDGRGRDWQGLARAILRRRRGAGADRLAVISKPEDSFHLRVLRPDGEAGPCADAALCAARYLLDSGRSGTDSIRLRTAEGEAEVDVLDSASLGISLGPPLGLPDGGALDQEAAASRATSVEASGERFQILPLRAGIPAADAVAVFAEGGLARAKARISASRGEAAPTVVAVRVASRGELLVSPAAGGDLDLCAAAAVALSASAAVGYADREALVKLGSSALWVEWAQSGSLYVVARPEYVFRGEFHLE
jgi:Diaminopimelate epimerase